MSNDGMLTAGESATAPGSPSSAAAHDLVAGLRAARRAAADGETEGLTRGAVVDRYVVLRQLGRGGMGIVYLAHDPELDRRVALKLLAPAADGPGAQGRLLREAQALARLAHPNVVAVHDVGTHAGGVWIAMEFVAGQTLRGWGGAPRRWSEVLGVLIAVARGVAAAHAAGLVHRDLKPDNVMIDGEGRVRVMDFGLARHGGAVDRAVDTTLESMDSLARPVVTGTRRPTHTGALPGTPMYMAPEQWEGQVAEVAADQFSWCVMAWELLYGERPFHGATMVLHAEAVLAGRLSPPPRGRKVPGWLRRVVERGLAVRAVDRWPSMTALLAALELGRTRARLRVGAGVLAGLALVGLAGAAYDRWDGARRVAGCAADGAEIAAVWNDEVRRGVREALLATTVAYAATTADKVMPWLDRQADAWRAGRDEVCRHVEVEGTWPAELLDRAVWCLDERKVAMAALVDELGRPDAAMVAFATMAVTKLKPVAPCLDAALLQRHRVPPEDRREAVRAVIVRLSQAVALELAGRFSDGRVAAQQAREQAARVGWPPIWAATRFREGRLMHDLGSFDEAATTMAEAYFAAVRAEAWQVAADASTELIGTTGVFLARREEGLMWARHAEAAAALAGDLEGLRAASRENNLGNIAVDAGRYTDALVHFEAALVGFERTLGPEHPTVSYVHNNLGNLHFTMGSFAAARTSYIRGQEILERALGGDAPLVRNSVNNIAATMTAMGEYEEATALHRRNLAAREALLGPDHPDVAQSVSNLALTLTAMGHHVEARSAYARALRLAEAAYGADHPLVADTLHNLAMLENAAGRTAEARTLEERALVVLEKLPEAEHSSVARSLMSLAIIHRDAGELATADTLLTRAVPLLERTLGAGHPDVAEAILDRGKLRRAQGDVAAALTDDQTALARSEELLGPSHPQVAGCLAELARLHLAGGREAEGLAALERAVVIFGEFAGDQPGESAARFELARALVASDGERARAEAAAARRGYAEIGFAARVAEVDAWLAGRGP